MTECMEQFPNMISNGYELTPWVEIILKENHTINTDALKKEAEKYPFEILKITLKKQQTNIGIEELLKNTKSIKELLPTEVFKLKCKEMGVNLEEKPQVLDAFNEVLQAVKNQ
jgi:exonuclease SbcD